MSAAANANVANEAAWHALSVDEGANRLSADTRTGLDAAEAEKRLQEYGPNRLPEGKKRGPLMRFLSQLNNVLVYVLLGAGFTKLMLNLWIDAAIIFGVVILNGLLGFIQEGKAEKALESIRNMLSAEARTVATRDPPEPDRDRREQRQVFCLTWSRNALSLFAVLLSHRMCRRT